jgi:hypothetical protein
MKHVALALVAAVAGAGLACRGGETRSAPEPGSAESRPAGGKPGPEGARPARPEHPTETTRQPAPTPAPVVIAEGTTLVFTLASAVSSDKSRPEDAVEARLSQEVRSGERAAIPAGSVLRGHVRVAQRSGKVKGVARLAVDFDRVEIKGKTYGIEASPIDVSAEKSTGRDAKIVGGAAVAGAIIGGIADGGGGAAKGGLIGGAAGGGAVLLTRGKEVELPAGSSHKIHLLRSVTLD